MNTNSMISRGFLTLFLFPSLVMGTDLECEHLPKIFDFYFDQHFACKSLTSELANAAATRFVELVDPEKLYLTESNAHALTKAVAPLFANDSDENCSVLKMAQDEMQRAVKSVATIATLGPDFKVVPAMSLPRLITEDKFAKNDEDRASRVRTRIQFDVAVLKSAGVSLEKAKQIAQNKYKNLDSLTNKIKLLEKVVHAFHATLDKNSQFISSQGLLKFAAAMKTKGQSSVGLNCFEDRGNIAIHSLVPGSAAQDNNELLPGDRIIAAGEKNEELELLSVHSDWLQTLKGPTGSSVRLVVYRPSTSEVIVTNIQRKQPDIDARQGRLLVTKRTRGKEQLRIGTIEMTSFYGGSPTFSSARRFNELLREAKKKAVDSLVIDLSQNEGGVLQEVTRSAGLFLGEAAIGAIKTRSKRQELNAEDGSAQFQGPIVVLTSSDTTSGAELFAGALQDYKRALIVGARTGGSGTVQIMKPLPNKLGAVKNSIGTLLTPKGREFESQGLTPDIQFFEGQINPYAHPHSVAVTCADRHSKNREVSSMTDPSKDNEWSPIDNKIKTQLTQSSLNRRNKSPTFKKATSLAKKKAPSQITIAQLTPKKKNSKPPSTLKNIENAALKEAIDIAADWAAIARSTTK